MENNKKILPIEDTDEKIESADNIKAIETAGNDDRDIITDAVNENKAQTALEALLLEDATEFNAERLEEDNANYEAVLAEYHELMHKAVTISEVNSEQLITEGDDADKEIEVEAKELDESDFLISLPENKPTDDSDNKASRHSEITLIPEELEDDESDYLVAPTPSKSEDSAATEEILGYEELPEAEDDDFQLSFHFGEEKAHVEKEEEADSDEDEKYDPEHPRFRDYVFEFVELFVFTLAAVIILTSFLFRHSVVDGDSMLSTLENGDHLIISDVFYTPERGDIVVFEDYSTYLKKAVIKRVIGLPGEVVEIKAEGSVYAIYIDGVLYEEYARHGASTDLYHTGIWTVGEGEIFVLGDNRYNSTDSRHSAVGTIHIDTVLGKVLLRFYPIDKFGSVD